MLNQKTFQIAAPTAIQDPDVRALLSCCQAGAATFHSANSTIYAQGDATGPLYLVEFGTVRICQVTSDGRRQITRFCHSGDVFGLEDGSEHLSYAESVDGAAIRVLRPADAAAFAHRILALALRGFARMQSHVVLLGRMGATERMARFLLELADWQEDDRVIHLPMQRNDIADYLGLTFETVSRVLRVLKDKAIIRVQSVDRIEVLDLDSLASLSE